MDTLEKHMNNHYSFYDMELLWSNEYRGWGNRTFLTDFISPMCQFIYRNNCNSDLLDLGCGDGNKSLIFTKLGFNVTGIDSSEERIKEARMNNRGSHFICQKIDGVLPFSDNSFDVVFSCGFFQYITHEPILKEIRRVLKPEGHFIFIENLKYNPITYIGRLLLKLIKFPYQSYPWNHFTVKKITAVQKSFHDSNIYFANLFTPLTQFFLFKKLYPFFRVIDKIFLPLFIKLSWLVMVTGKNNK
jgi:SAM-dependent methyltransferase